MKTALHGALLAARIVLAANPAFVQPIDGAPKPHGNADAIWFTLAAPCRCRPIETDRGLAALSARGPIGPLIHLKRKERL
jgi:hypothetical protein